MAEGLDGGAGELAGHGRLDLQPVAQVGRRAEGPALPDLKQMHAAIGIEPGQLLQQPGDIGALGQALRQGFLGHRLSCGEQRRLQEAQQLEAIFAHDGWGSSLRRR